MAGNETIAQLCPVLAELLQGGKLVGRTGRIYEDVPALSTLNNLLAIHGLMCRLKPERTLEVGLAFGGSALAFCATHRVLGHAPEAQHMAFDPFQTSVWDSCGLMALERAGLSGYLDFRKTPSAIGLARLAEERSEYDPRLCRWLAFVRRRVRRRVLCDKASRSRRGHRLR